jgi:hypothetical protein
MDRPRHERRHHFRGKSRPGRIMRVRLRTKPTADWISTETRNIGVGGAFILLAPPLAIGTTVTVELRLPTTDQVFALPAVVRWARHDESAGIGVQFVGVDVDVLLELNDYFATLTGT